MLTNSKEKTVKLVALISDLKLGHHIKNHKISKYVMASDQAEIELLYICKWHNAILSEEGCLLYCEKTIERNGEKIFIDEFNNEITAKELQKRIHNFVLDECFKSDIEYVI